MISDYSELIAEVTRRTGVSDVANRAAMFTGLAEDDLSKRLRSLEMETTATLTTDVNGIAALPTDYEEMRSIRVGTCRLERLPLDTVTDNTKAGYAIVNNNIQSTHGEKDHVITYYAKIPSLAQNKTNWLLQKNPIIYVHAVMVQAYLDAMDEDKVIKVSGLLETLINAANSAAHLQRHAGTHMQPVRIR